MKNKMVFSVLIIVVPTWIFGLMRMPTEMGLSLTAGAIGASFLNIDKIQRFRGAGFEAEMKKVVDEAYATINNLKETAKPLIVATYKTLTHGKRLGSMKPHTEHKIKEQLENICDSLSINDDQDVFQANEEYYRYQTWDHYIIFVEALSRNTTINKEKVKQLSSYKDYQSDNYPKLEDIKKVIENMDLEELDTDTKNKLEDYLYYLEHCKLRRNESLIRI